MLNWANQFNIFCFLDNRRYDIQPRQYECILGAGVDAFVESGTLNDLDAFLLENKRLAFGHLSYDLKEEIHHIGSDRESRIGFPDFYFFVPRYLLQLKETELLITAPDPDAIFRDVIDCDITDRKKASPVTVRSKLSKEQYLEKIKGLQQHIVRGDCYEINFCQEFFAENAHIDALEVFLRLMELSPNPFSAFYKLEDKFLICASPERFLTRRGTTVLSQPMKGTIKRDRAHKEADAQLKRELQESAKDRAENVMIVDMVRNDLTKICEPGSVKVDELFGVYAYPQVYQMISTVSGKINPAASFSEIIRATFPMGSMTGAPKHRVMELIDEYEDSPRDIFSGSVGYIDPGGDFDFNVVIRSVMYNAATGYLSYRVGSGITFYSDPEKEWEECLLKGEAIKKVLTS
jgi:para-aminobenzoate synthetase component 1